MEIFKEIASSLQPQTRVFERPMRLDSDDLAKLKASKLRQMLTEMDRFCDEVLSQNQSMFGENQVLRESLETQKEKFLHLMKVNSQLGESVNRQALLHSSANLVCESLLQIFESDQGALDKIRKALKVDPGKKKETPEDQPESETGEIVEVLRKLIKTVDKLYICEFSFFCLICSAFG